MSRSILFDEIHEQPQALDRVLTESQPAIDALVAEIRRRDIRYVVLAARGTSDNASVYGRYLLEIICGIPVGLAAPSVHTLYGAKLRYRDALVIGVSQSGAGEDVNTVVEAARASGALTAAFTNTTDSPLAGIAEHVISCHAGVERAIAATKSYSTTLALFAMLAAAWGESDVLRDNLAGLAAAAEKAIAASLLPTNRVAESLMHANRLLTVARGLHFATAIEAALKIAETSYTTTQAFSSADLLHGPIASVDARTPCAVFLPAGETVQMMGEVVGRLESVGARVLRFAMDGDIPLVSAGTELLSPMVDIIPAQLLAYSLTVARGLDPDRPRGLSKVTITR